MGGKVAVGGGGRPSVSFPYLKDNDKFRYWPGERAPGDPSSNPSRSLSLSPSLYIISSSSFIFSFFLGFVSLINFGTTL